MSPRRPMCAPALAAVALLMTQGPAWAQEPSELPVAPLASAPDHGGAAGRILALADAEGLPAAVAAANAARMPPADKDRLLGHLYLRAKDVPAARRHLRRAVKAAPERAAAWLELALAEHLGADPQASLRALAQGRRLGQDRAAFYALGAENLRALHDPIEADRLLTAGVKRLGDEPSLLRLQVGLTLDLGLVQLALTRAEALARVSARPRYERRWVARRLVAAKAPRAAATVLEAARAAAPKDAEIAAELAWAYAQANLPHVAARVIDPERLGSAEHAYAAAELYRGAGDTQAALRVNRLVTPERRRRGQRATILVEAGRLDQALAAAAGLKPERLEDPARFALGFAAVHTARPHRALAYLDAIEAPERFAGLKELRRRLERARR